MGRRKGRSEQESERERKRKRKRGRERERERQRVCVREGLFCAFGVSCGGRTDSAAFLSVFSVPSLYLALL
jgi:hypothetical protein